MLCVGYTIESFSFWCWRLFPQTMCIPHTFPKYVKYFAQSVCLGLLFYMFHVVTKRKLTHSDNAVDGKYEYTCGKWRLRIIIIHTFIVEMWKCDLIYSVIWFLKNLNAYCVPSYNANGWFWVIEWEFTVQTLPLTTDTRTRWTKPIVGFLIEWWHQAILFFETNNVHCSMGWCFKTELLHRTNVFFLFKRILYMPWKLITHSEYIVSYT